MNQSLKCQRVWGRGSVDTEIYSAKVFFKKKNKIKTFLYIKENDDT